MRKSFVGGLQRMALVFRTIVTRTIIVDTAITRALVSQNLRGGRQMLNTGVRRSSYLLVFRAFRWVEKGCLLHGQLNPSALIVGPYI